MEEIAVYLTKEELKQLEDALREIYEEKYRNIPGEKISVVLNKLLEAKKKIVG